MDNFLFDTGIWKATARLEANFSFVFSKSKKSKDKIFSAYQIKSQIPITYFYHFGELAFLSSLFYSAPLESKIAQYRLSKTYQEKTSRIDFKPPNEYYNFIFSQEIENRFYVFRFWYPHNHFFISLFANIGVGFQEDKHRKFLYHVGAGIGYTLADGVPFTVQFGMNQNRNFVMFIGVVSRVIHQP